MNNPEIEWDLIKGMRNFITHEYFGVDLGRIRETAVSDLPNLKPKIEKIIFDLEKS